MQIKNKKLQLNISSICAQLAFLFLLVSQAFAAATFAPIPGTEFYCEFLPNGKNLITTKKGSSRNLISKAMAIGQLKKKALQYTQEKRKLQVYLNEVKKSPGDLTIIFSPLKASQIKEVAAFEKFLSTGKPPPYPKTKGDQIALLEKLIGEANGGKANVLAGITNVTKCANNERKVVGTITSAPIVEYNKFGQGSVSIARLFLFDADLVQQAGYPKGTNNVYICFNGVAPKFFLNPCYFFSLDPNSGCTSAEKLMFGWLSDPPEFTQDTGLTPDQIKSEEETLQQKWDATPLTGRVVTNSKDPCIVQ